MKDKWLKDIQNRMADYEIAEPEGLWDAVEAGCRGARRRRGIIFLPRVRRLAVAAAIMALLSVGALWLYVGSPDMSIPDATIAAIPQPSTPANNLQPEQNIDQSNSPSKTAVIGHVAAPSSAVPDEHTQVPASQNVEISETSDSSNSSNDGSDFPNPPQTKSSRQKYYDNPSRYIARKKSSSPLALGVFAFGGSGIKSGNSRGRDMWSTSADKFLGEGENPDKEDTRVSRAFPPDYLDYSHHLPIRVGLTLKYDFNSRFAIESGLSYTYLGSDIKSNHTSGEQSLHYIGIPLNLKYRIASWRSFDLYASAGVLAEKCVSAKYSISRHVDGRIVETKTEQLDDKPFQFSLNAGAGIQWNISPAVGLYAEPGVSYYFDDNTQIKTIYKERPLEFNLNFGLRFTLGSKN